MRTLLREGNLVTLGSDIAGGALLAMNKVITMSIRASKFRHMQSDGKDEFLTVEEGYYLGSSAGHEYFGGHGGFVPGDKLHAIVVDDSDFTEAAHPLSVRERFERAIYMMHRHNIISVWSEGKTSFADEKRGEGAPLSPIPENRKIFGQTIDKRLSYLV